MRVLLIEDDSAMAQSIELMLKVDSFNVYTTDLGEEGIDLGKIYDYDIACATGIASAARDTRVIRLLVIAPLRAGCSRYGRDFTGLLMYFNSS